MALWLHVYGGYPSYEGLGLQWNDDDWRAFNFVKALKGQPLKGFAWLQTSSGAWVKINQSNPAGAFRVFGEWGAAKLPALGLDGGWLVPVPSSSCAEIGNDPKGKRLAEAVAQRHGGFDVLEALCWDVKFKKAAEGGPRDHQTLFENLTILERLPDGEVVLIDDVATGGGHLTACAAALRGAGMRVRHALCAAQTVNTRPQDMFAIASRDLEASW